ncbi:MAG: S-adenosylmethionine:tRNA ribosyltransferase-isomerase, partial [Bacteroidota bacterium]
EKIASEPLANRTLSKLLVYNKSEILDTSFNQIIHFLPANTTLVFNNTKVVKARLFFQKSTGALIELFCLEPMKGITVEESFIQRESTCWICMVGNSKKWKDEILERRLIINGAEVNFTAKRIEQIGQESIIEFNWNNNTISFSEILEFAGELPLPPYMNRKANEEDKVRYNTVYAVHEGSVAAPTAGLHFSDSLLQELISKNVQMLNVLLHVGAGTFKPVKVDTMNDHEMHAERIKVSVGTIKDLINQKGNRKIIAIGTTSTRTLESLYWMGVQLVENKIPLDDFYVTQWEAYENNNTISAEDSLHALLSYAKKNDLEFIEGFTQIIISPGYQFKIIDGLITNFHQPQSTLLLLVSALIGNDWRKVYEHALNNDYRFLSYGDSSLLLP